MTNGAIYRLVFPIGLLALLAACDQPACPEPPVSTLNATCSWETGTVQGESAQKTILVCQFEGKRVASDTSGVGEG